MCSREERCGWGELVDLRRRFSFLAMAEATGFVVNWIERSTMLLSMKNSSRIIENRSWPPLVWYIHIILYMCNLLQASWYIYNLVKNYNLFILELINRKEAKEDKINLIFWMSALHPINTHIISWSDFCIKGFENFNSLSTHWVKRRLPCLYIHACSNHIFSEFKMVNKYFFLSFW